MAALDPREVAGIKVFMGASTGNMLVDDPQVLERCSPAPTILLAHCEHTPSILANEAWWRDRHGETSAGRAPLIRDAEACYRSSSLAVELARCTARCTCCTSPPRGSWRCSKPARWPANASPPKCACTTCFRRQRLRSLGHLIKCNPAIKTASDREALRRALAEDRIDVIGTDHAPHTLEEKRRT
jgi:dihydroorotase